ncbi:hypothetical protein M432DRAFT_638628 [Thermoascus aurantiacus ATCC 26904]
MLLLWTYVQDRAARARQRAAPTTSTLPVARWNNLVRFLLFSLRSAESSLSPRPRSASPVPLLGQRLLGSLLATPVDALTRSHLAKDRVNSTPAFEVTPELASPPTTHAGAFPVA